jgi:hypothetical protein
VQIYYKDKTVLRVEEKILPNASLPPQKGPKKDLMP